MGGPEITQRYTLAEYLALEAAADFKSEFYNGEIFAMSGGTPAHSRIAVNCTHALVGAFDPQGCDVYESSLMVHIEKLNAVLYPDAAVLCGTPETDYLTPNLVRNPALILEVLSKGTARYDRGSKFLKYQLIPSLQTYVMVEQSEPRVFVGHRNVNGEWGFTDYFGLEAEVELKPLGVTISMAQIYKRIEF